MKIIFYCLNFRRMLKQLSMDFSLHFNISLSKCNFNKSTLWIKRIKIKVY